MDYLFMWNLQVVTKIKHFSKPGRFWLMILTKTDAAFCDQAINKVNGEVENAKAELH